MRGIPVAAVALGMVLGGAACVIYRRPLTVPQDGVPTVLVCSGRLGQPLKKIARHAWLAVRGEGDDRWERWEVWGGGSESWGSVSRREVGPLEWDPEMGGVMIHGVHRGAKAQRMIECIRREAPRYRHRHGYVFWPGPNSNTFIDAMLRACGIHTDLPASAVGKDWRGWIGVSWTSGGTGFQIETPLIGLKLGLTEGIEIHILTLSFGIDWWPPAIILPFEEGRIGFDDR